MAKEAPNGDVFPSAKFVAAHSALEPLVVNKAAGDEFARHERAAVLWKRAYVAFGVTSLWSAAGAIVLIAWQLTFGADETNVVLNGFGVALGGVGLGAQSLLILLRMKRRWLLARFAAERVRCLKFQAFLAAGDASGSALKAVVERFTGEQIGSLDLGGLRGEALPGGFDPDAETFKTGAFGGLTGDDLAQRKQVYLDLRLKVQCNYFAYEADRDMRRRVLPEQVSEVLFWLGSLLALAQLASPALGPEVNATIERFAPAALQSFVVIVLFAISAVLAVYHYGRAHFASAERYRQYKNAVERLMARLPAISDGDAFSLLVAEMEHVALSELADFYRDNAPRTLVL